MGRYDDFLTQLKEDHKTTAQMAMKRLYLLLKEEDPNLSNDDMYDRILKDCLVIWARATIIENMPDELKDSERQEAGRRGAEAKKKLLRVTNDGNVARDVPANSNLFEQKQIESQTLEQGSTKRDNTSSTIVDKEVDDYQISTIDHPVSSSFITRVLFPLNFHFEYKMSWAIYFQAVVKSITMKTGCGSAVLLIKVHGK